MQRYTENTVAKFDDLIRESDPPVQYSVAVDDLTVVSRTADPERFMLHARYVDGETTRVTIKMYHGAGNRNEETVLWLKAPKPDEQATLAGVQQQVAAGIAAERERWEHQRALDEIERLKAEAEDSEKYIGKLEKELAEYRGKKLHVGDVNLLEVLGFVAEGFVKRNPSIVARLPGGEALAGAIMQENMAKGGEWQPSHSEPAPEFSRASPESQPDEQEAAYVTLIRELGMEFSKEEFARVMGIIGELVEDRRLLPELERYIEETRPAMG